MTNYSATEIGKSGRLAAIAERIGLALWQLQELESGVAHYLVLKLKATSGMGQPAGDELVAKALSRPFGVTLKDISNANLFEPAIQARLGALLAERNWLVHRSLASSRSAVQADSNASTLIQRIDAIHNESLALLRVVGTEIETVAVEGGVSSEYICAQAATISRNWDDPDAA